MECDLGPHIYFLPEYDFPVIDQHMVTRQCVNHSCHSLKTQMGKYVCSSLMGRSMRLRPLDKPASLSLNPISCFHIKLA